MVRLIAAVAALSLWLAGCGIPDCSKLGHRVECTFTDAGTVSCVDAGWADAGWYPHADECPPAPFPGAPPAP